MEPLIRKPRGPDDNADETCRQMEVLALPDAGFFLDVPDHEGVGLFFIINSAYRLFGSELEATFLLL